MKIKYMLVAAAVPWLLAGGPETSAADREKYKPDTIALSKTIRKAYIQRGYDNLAPKVDWIAERVKLITKYAVAANLKESIDELIPLLCQESKLGMEPDRKHAWGIGNITYRYEDTFIAHARKIFNFSGELDRENLEHQVMVAVAAYHLHYKASKKNKTWEPVKRYNGLGKPPRPLKRSHVQLVQDWKKQIYGK